MRCKILRKMLRKMSYKMSYKMLRKVLCKDASRSDLSQNLPLGPSFRTVLAAAYSPNKSP